MSSEEQQFNIASQGAGATAGADAVNAIIH